MPMPTHRVLAALVSLTALATTSLAQSINIKLGAPSITTVMPAPVFGGAASSPGWWNNVYNPAASNAPLFDTTGAPTPANISIYATSQAASAEYAGTNTDDVARLLNTGLSLPPNDNCSPPNIYLSMDGIARGTYDVYVYARKPADSGDLFDTRVQISATGVTTNDYLAGTPVANTFSSGVTHIVRRVHVPASLLSINIMGTSPCPGSIVNGIQFVLVGLDDCQVTPPTPQVVPANLAATFFCPTSGNIQAMKWTRNGSELADVRGLFGTSTSRLVITECRPSDDGVYALKYLCDGQWFTTPGATLTVTPPCVTDVDDGSGTGAADGGVTIDDLLYFLARFEAGC